MGSRSTKLILSSGTNPATLQRLPICLAAPGEDSENTCSHTPADVKLPVLLAGPILRRAAPDAIYVWVATSAPVIAEVTILRPASGLGAPPEKWIRMATARGGPLCFGRYLYLTLIRVVPTEGLSFPRTSPPTILGYDITFHAPEGYEFADGDGLVAHDEIAYPGIALPTFSLGYPGDQPVARVLDVIHGSCRKLHGPGVDAIEGIDAYLQSVAQDPAKRPSALLLTGDQIYADDVSSGIITAVQAAAKMLLGYEEKMPDGRRPRDIDRGNVLRAEGFTVDEGVSHNHLMGFGEFASMYLFAWSKVLWDHPVLNGYNTLSRQASVAAARRALANAPTYMIMDDHEVTDDWPLTADMAQQVRGSDVAGWVVANAMAACWAFQLWGNAEGIATSPPFLESLTDYLAMGEDLGAKPAPAVLAMFQEARKKYVTQVLATRGYSFVAPTVPPIIFMDERTQRDLHIAEAPGRLNGAGFAALQTALTRIPGGQPTLIVAPGPVLGYDTVESLQRPKEGKPLDVENDPEAWSFDPRAYRRLFSTLSQSKRKNVVFFSGDVHFAYVEKAQYISLDSTDPSVNLLQLTSSALCNEPESYKRQSLYAGTSLGVGMKGTASFYMLAADGLPTRYFFPEKPGDEILARYKTQPVAVALLPHEYLPVLGGGGIVYAENNFAVVHITWDDQGAPEVQHQLRAAKGWQGAVTTAKLG